MMSSSSYMVFPTTDGNVTCSDIFLSILDYYFNSCQTVIMTVQAVDFVYKAFSKPENQPMQEML